jgi:hypothetical protein
MNDLNALIGKKLEVAFEDRVKGVVVKFGFLRGHDLNFLFIETTEGNEAVAIAKILRLKEIMPCKT